MFKPESYINISNALPALRYLLNLDLNNLEEKYLKMGAINFINLAQTKLRCFYAIQTNEISPQKLDELVTHAITLTTLLNDEAKNNLVEFLAINQSY